MAEILTAAANLVRIAAKFFEMNQSDSFISAVNLIADAANWQQNQIRGYMMKKVYP